MDAPPLPSTSPSTPPCWSNIVKNQPRAPPAVATTTTTTTTTNKVLVEGCKSTKGISIAVIDANAVIQGGEKLHNMADKFVTVPEVLAEIRDPVSRHRLSFVPFTIDAMDPSPESVSKVIKFARATGDLQTLSDVDLKLIALTYTLEAQIHGIKHVRDAPPSIRTVKVRRLPEKDMPGWGSNVPNLEEWEVLEHEAGDGSNNDSRILPLKEMSLNVVATDDRSEDGLVVNGSESQFENSGDGEYGLREHTRYPLKKKEISIEGKKMVADGVDASQGEFDDNASDWMPAVSRSTHRRYLRRKARREYYEAISETDSQLDVEKIMDNENVHETTILEPLLDQSSEMVDSVNGISEKGEMKNGDEDLTSILKQMRLEEDSLKALQETKEGKDTSAGLDFTNSVVMEVSSDKNENDALEAGGVDIANEELDHLEDLSQTNETVHTSHVDDDASESSWMLRSLSESSIACVTGDFAMQNVLLQMGLRILAPGGLQIHQLRRWILKCHACYMVTAEIGRIFCPKCGNGGTLRKVAVTVGENGIVLADRRPRINLRGTKFSLPLPQGGRDAITKNLILREDQLPQKFLYPKTKKKTNKQGDNFFAPDYIFSHHTDKKAAFQPPMRKALAVFSGKRNPNDNHYSRPKR